MKSGSIIFLAVLVLACTTTARAEKKWTEVQSPHFRVITDGSQSDGRQVALQLEQLRYVFASQFPKLRLDSGAPLLVFAVSDAGTARFLLPMLKKTKGGQYIAGLYFHGWEKQYAVLQFNAPDIGPVYHEYVHSILHMNARLLPTWLDEGIAEYYGYTRFEDHKIYIGAPSIRATMLREYPLIPIEKLFTPDPKSAGDPIKENLFYAESWALVHFMTFGPGMQGGDKLVRFFSLLQNGEDQKTAFQQVFGGFEQMDKALERYAQQYAFPAGVISSPPSIDKKNFSARILPPAEADAQIAALEIWTHQVKDALPFAQRAVSLDPKLGIAHEDMGFALFSQGQDDAAESEFSQAYALDSTLYLSLFAKTMLSPVAHSASPADEDALKAALKKVIDLNPQFAPGFVELARLAIRKNDLQRAFALSRRAEELEPGRAEYHLLSGQILLHQGKDADAAAFAKYVADRWKGPDQDEAVDLWKLVPASDRGPALDPIDPPPVGVSTITGVLKSATCNEKPFEYAITVGDGEKALKFHAKAPFAMEFSDTLWYGEDHFTECHNVEGMQVVVRYRRSADDGFDGDLTEVEFRDSFPFAPLSAAAPSSATVTSEKNSKSSE